MSGKESPASPKPKPTFFQRLFGRSKSSSGATSPSASGEHHHNKPPSNKDRRHQSSSDVDDRQQRRSGSDGRNSVPTSPTKPKPRPSPILAPAVRLQTSGTHGGACSDTRSPTKATTPTGTANNAQRRLPPRPPAGQNSTSGKDHRGGARSKTTKHRKREKKAPEELHIDLSKPLEYPCTPEMILAHHKSHPFLDRNEEWLLVELNEFECLVDSLEIIKIIAKHSKFFEVEPDELWEEFFEYVDEMPSYDEVINFDVWQEFRDNKYPC